VNTGSWWFNLKERGPLEDPGLDEGIILRWVIRKSDGVLRLDGSGSGKGQVAGTCEYGDEPSGFHKMRGSY